MDETTPSGKALLSAFGAAPSFVQEFVRSGEFLAFSERLEAKLPVENAVKAKVSNELLMTLLGITTPKDLPDNLVKEAGLPEELTDVVIEEAREGMFEPLIARAGGEAAPDLPMIVNPGQKQPQTAKPAPASPLATFHVDTERALPPTPARPSIAPKPAAPVRPVPPPPRIEAVPPPAPTKPAAMPRPAASALGTIRPRTMASDIEAMQPHEAKQAPLPPSPKPAPLPSETPAAAKNIHADLKQYGVDPYREPIE